MLTPVWFLFGVDAPYVSLQARWMRKTFLTIWTLVWFLFGMSSDVGRQERRTWKTFLAILTLEWFLFGVCPHVSVQVSLL